VEASSSLSLSNSIIAYDRTNVNTFVHYFDGIKERHKVDRLLDYIRDNTLPIDEFPNSQYATFIHRGYLKMHPKLCQYAIKNDLVMELYTFYCLRYLNTDSSGFLRKDYVVKNLQTVFDMSRSKVYRLLDSIKGELYYETFDKQGNEGLQLLGIDGIGYLWNVHPLTRPILVPINRCKTLAKINAWFMGLSVYFTNDYDKLISPMGQGLIETLTGVNPRNQQRYNKLLPLNVKKNFKDELVTYTGKYKEYQCLKRLGNSYSLNALRCHKGMISRINRKINAKLKGEQCSLIEDAIATEKRRTFFTDAEDYLGHKKRTTSPLIIKSKDGYQTVWQDVVKIAS